MNYSFRRAEKLHLQRDFQRVLKSGRRLVHPAIFIFICPRHEPGETRRLGLIFSRKLGGAAERNRLKRRLREIFRLHKHLLLPGLDMIFMPRPGAASLNYRQLELAVLTLWRKAAVLNENGIVS